MAGKNTINAAFASRYAEAFYNEAVEKKKLKDISSDFDKLSLFIADSDTFKSIVANPRFSSKNNQNLIAILGKELKLSKLTLQMLNVVAAHKRMSDLGSIVNAFKNKEFNMSGEIRVEVTTARKLNRTLAKKIEKAIQETKKSKLHFEETVDPDIYGGLILKIDNLMIDLSLRSKLNKLSQTIRGT